MPPENQLFKSLQGRPWALQPAKIEEIYAFLDRRLSGEKLEFPEAAARPGRKEGEKAYQTVDGVAVLPVYGVIDKRMNMFSRYSGGTSTELLARDFEEALADPQVQAILLDVDSPGGSVDGPKALADLIHQSREQKPIVAFANGLMASAAYWIGSAAETIVAPETAEVGSISVVAMHYDYSVADEKAGVKRTAITSGPYKRIASDEKPLSKEGAAYIQDAVNTYHGLFVEAVARNRGIEADAVQEKMADGRIFIGKKALKAGLVDQMGNFNDALALARAKGGAMPKNMTKEMLQAENPELVQALLAEGAAGVTLEALLGKQPEAAEKLRAEGREAAVQAERERIVKIFKAAGGQGLLLQVMENGTSHVEALELFLASHEQVKAEGLKAMQVAMPPALGTDPLTIETHEGQPEPGSIEAQAKAEWDKTPALKAEYGTFERFLIVKKHEGDIKSK